MNRAELTISVMGALLGLTACAAQMGEPQVIGLVHDPRLNELSGIVESRRHPDHFYTHNDSGGAASVYLIERNGELRAEFRLQGARNIDWEDISLAPAAGGVQDVCVADVGDNQRKRGEVTLYRFAEPALPEARGSAVDVTPQSYRLRYSDGPHNAEAFMVHPRSGDGYVLTKSESGGADLYRLAAPWSWREVNVLSRVAAAEFPSTTPLSTILTAGDISHDGRRLLARGYPLAWEWRLPSEGPESAFGDIVARPATEITIHPEPQGEAICYSADGRMIYTISEGTPTRLIAIPLAAPAASRPAP